VDDGVSVFRRPARAFNRASRFLPPCLNDAYDLGGARIVRKGDGENLRHSIFRHVDPGTPRRPPLDLESGNTGKLDHLIVDIITIEMRPVERRCVR
jgi:hypothetical protein